MLKIDAQGDLVTYSTILTRLGFRSGYRITSYEGWYSDNRTGQPTPTLVKGEQGRIFIIASEQTWSQG
jgi:hypothetical protein